MIRSILRIPLYARHVTHRIALSFTPGRALVILSVAAASTTAIVCAGAPEAASTRQAYQLLDELHENPQLYPHAETDAYEKVGIHSRRVQPDAGIPLGALYCTGRGSWCSQSRCGDSFSARARSIQPVAAQKCGK